MAFKIGKFPGVEKQMRVLADFASFAGIRKNYFDALNKMVQHLETDPVEWGDPVHRTQSQGGMVFNGLVDPILVRYVVYESEQVVLIIEIAPLFEWPVRP